jgi:hypothetical protein
LENTRQFPVIFPKEKLPRNLEKPGLFMVKEALRYLMAKTQNVQIYNTLLPY